MKHLLILFLIINSTISFSQTYDAQIVNNNNDTINTKILIKGDMIFKNNKILSIQEKITVLSGNSQKDYYPKDIKSFRIRLDGKKSQTYDNVDNLLFAERLYSNKIKLYYKLVRKETNRSPYFVIYRVFLVKKPNDEKIVDLYPNGFSRLITQDEMLKKFTDCKISFDKIKNDEIKIRNEDILVEFITDYEKNCFNN